jgi:hypothetical protein
MQSQTQSHRRLLQINNRFLSAHWVRLRRISLSGARNAEMDLYKLWAVFIIVLLLLLVGFSFHIAGNMKRTLIVVDPCVTKTAMMADLHLPVKPRSDIAPINGIAHIRIREGLIYRQYIAAHTNGYEEFAEHVSAVRIHRDGTKRGDDPKRGKALLKD